MGPQESNIRTGVRAPGGSGAAQSDLPLAAAPQPPRRCRSTHSLAAAHLDAELLRHLLLLAAVSSIELLESQLGLLLGTRLGGVSHRSGLKLLTEAQVEEQRCARVLERVVPVLAVILPCHARVWSAGRGVSKWSVRI